MSDEQVRLRLIDAPSPAGFDASSPPEQPLFVELVDFVFAAQQRKIRLELLELLGTERLEELTKPELVRKFSHHEPKMRR